MNTMGTFVILLFLYPLHILTLECIPEVFIALGWRRINMIHESPSKALKMLQNLSSYDISVKLYKDPDLLHDIPIAIFGNDNIETAQNIIKKRPSESVMLISSSFTILETFKKVQFVKSFYFLHSQEKDLKLIITSRHKPILVQNPISLSIFPQPNKQVHYDLQGTKIDGISLDWWPYNRFGPCATKNKDCQMFGIIPTLLRNLGDMYNFSMKYDREPYGKWGSLPIQGSYLEQNAVFEVNFSKIRFL